MARIEIPEGEAPESVRVFMHRPQHGAAAAALTSSIYEHTMLPPRVRECVRMRIALINGCRLCLSVRFPEFVEAGVTEEMYAEVETWRSATGLSDAEKAAIEYAELFATDHRSIDQDFMDRLRAHFDDATIFDLTFVIGGLLANGRILAVLGVDEVCDVRLPMQRNVSGPPPGRTS